MASRALKDDELSQGVTGTVINGIAVVVNLENPIENLTTEQVQGIYMGPKSLTGLRFSKPIAEMQIAEHKAICVETGRPCPLFLNRGLYIPLTNAKGK